MNISPEEIKLAVHVTFFNETYTWENNSNIGDIIFLKATISFFHVQYWILKTQMHNNNILYQSVSFSSIHSFLHNCFCFFLSYYYVAFVLNYYSLSRINLSTFLILKNILCNFLFFLLLSVNYLLYSANSISIFHGIILRGILFSL